MSSHTSTDETAADSTIGALTDSAVSDPVSNPITAAWEKYPIGEIFNLLIIDYKEFTIGGIIIILFGLLYLTFHKNKVAHTTRSEQFNDFVEKVLRHMRDIEITFNNEMKEMKNVLIKIEQAKIKDRLKILIDNSSQLTANEADSGNDLLKQSEEHQIKVEERIEQIVALVKQQTDNQNKNGDDNTQFSATAQKLNEVLEKQSLYLHEELTAITDKINALATVKGDESSPNENAALADALMQINDKVDALANTLKTENIQNENTAPAFTDALMQISDKVDALANTLKTENIQNGNAAPAFTDVLTQISDKVDALQKQNAASTSSADNTTFFEMIAQSMNRLSSEVDAKLTLLNGKLEKNMETRWSDTLTSINNLREQIQELSQTGEQMKSISKNVSSLSRMLLTRAGIGEESGRQQLAELLPQILSSEHFQLDFDLPNGHCAAALVRFPDPRDSVAIDASISIQTFFETMDENISPGDRDHKQQTFRRELASHINYVADNLIFPPHTGESALLFIPSEAAFASIHAHHRAVVQLALSRRVWLVSPTTLLAVLNTANTAIKDHQANLQLQQLQATVSQIVEEAQHFEYRLTEIGDHVNSAWRSVQRAENASGRLIGSIRNISQSSENNIPLSPPADNDNAS